MGWDISKDALDHLDGTRSSAAKRAADARASMADDGTGSSDSDESGSDALDETAFDPDHEDIPLAVTRGRQRVASSSLGHLSAWLDARREDPKSMPAVRYHFYFRTGN